MDIFKLLSRSTKPTHKSTFPASHATKLPSAGASINPQLYHDPVANSRGIKRKRVDQTAGAEHSLDVDDELNFFAPKSAQQTNSKTDHYDTANETTEDIRRKPSNIHNATPNILEDEVCRQILKSHRLKVTLLSSNSAMPLDGRKPRKKIKKKPQDEANKRKGEHKQLYPQPLTAFEDLQSTYGISKRLGENLAMQGYKIPTEVQMGSLPMLLRPDVALMSSTSGLNVGSEVDLLAIAPTGSGKTLAFLIPVMNSIIQRRRSTVIRDSHLLDAIVVAPTKELASQIVNEGRKLAMGTGVRIIGMKKGMSVVERDSAGKDSDSDSSSVDEEDRRNLLINEVRTIGGNPKARPKADILVSTPLVLLNSLSKLSTQEKSLLPTVRHLILDEADVLLDPLFREQTLGIWEACVNPNLRVTFWSATMGSNIEALASQTIEARKKRLGLEIDYLLVRLVVGLKDSAIPNISHQLTYTANEPGKLLALRQLLHPTAKSSTSVQSLRPPFLVFTQTIARAIALHSELLYDIPAEAGGSSRIAVLHSDLSDPARDLVMTRFRNGEIWVLITTDILSRGVDFRGINGVVNYDVPNSGASYIHRVGRTGRAGRDGGIAVTLYTKEDIPFVKNVANIIAASEKQAGKTEAEGGVQKWLLDALPTPSKKEKKNLKLHGVEARRTTSGKGEPVKAKISTKSGYERKVENNRRGAILGSKRRIRDEDEADGVDDIDDSEWAGIED